MSALAAALAVAAVFAATTATVAAVCAAATALVVASFTLFVTAPWLRHDLDRAERALAACRSEARDLRRQVAIVFTALVAELPRDRQADLLLKLDDLTPPPPRSVLYDDDGEDD